MAREMKPSVIFIDEIDSIGAKRKDDEHETMRRVKTQLLVEMQGVGSDNEGVLVLAATNLPWEIDDALRRRLEKRIYISLPDEDSRKLILLHCIGKTPHTLTEEDWSELGSLTDKFSGSDLATLSKDAIMAPVRRL